MITCSNKCFCNPSLTAWPKSDNYNFLYLTSWWSLRVFFEEEIEDVEEAYDIVEEVEKDDGKQNKKNVEKERFSIYNMKSVARKVFPPGCHIDSSDDE